MSETRKIHLAEMPLDKKDRIQSLITSARIPAISIATVNSVGEIKSTALGLANTSQDDSKINSDTVFWACSLSKPVFAYLVIKLIEDGTIPQKDFLDEKIPYQGKILTPRMMLSHQTGLPNEGLPDATFQDFKPQQAFRYSGSAFSLLQTIIEERTDKKLHVLAQEKIFGPLGMTRSSFLFPNDEKNVIHPHNESIPRLFPLFKRDDNNNNAAASLHTTANDYARFLMAAITDRKFIEMITPQIENMEKDIDAKAKVSNQLLSMINWGLGFGLQKDETGKVISAFHWGHGPGARTFFAIDCKEGKPKSAVVYLTNDDNGMAIANEISKLTIGSIAPTIKFLADKYDYTQIESPSWEKNDELYAKYYQLLMTGIKKEREGDFDQAILSFNEAMILRPDKKTNYSNV